jgi:hypothetical protein
MPQTVLENIVSHLIRASPHHLSCPAFGFLPSNQLLNPAIIFEMSKEKKMLKARAAKRSQH